jgi:hypothetical protein
MAAATATADANTIDKSRIIRKPRLRAPRRSAGNWSCVQCFDVRAIRSRLSAWTLRPIQERVASTLRSGEIIADLIRDSAIVLICQPCLSEFGVKLDDIVPGVQLDSPGYLENFVFADNVRTLTW